MTNWRKAALGAIGAIALIAITGAFAFHFLLDSERLERIAREKVAAATGRQLALGAIALKLFPFPSLQADKVVLGPPPRARNATPIKAERIVARFELLPLLTGKARIKGLEVEGLQASLDAEGLASFSRPPPGAPSGGKAPDFMNLTYVSITDSHLTYRPKGAAAVFWHVESATAEASTGLRDVSIDAAFSRNHRPLVVKAQLADLSKAGEAGAVTQGRVEALLGKSRLVVEGLMPLEASLAKHDATLELSADPADDLLALIDAKQRLKAPLALKVRSSESQGVVRLAGIAAILGELRISGDAQVTMNTPKPSVTARLAIPRLDWARTMHDLGRPPIPPLPPAELFQSVPLAWPLLVSLQGTRGTVEATLGSVRLRNGIEMRNVKASTAFEDDRLDMRSFSIEVLGGSASGSLQLIGRARRAKVEFDGTNLSMERWLRERGSKQPFSGGPMKVKASFTAVGGDIKELAASLTGPVAIRMGPGVFASPKAGEAEATLMSAPESGQIDFHCIGASLPFRDGVASSQALIGARSGRSHLLTDGTLDLRRETIELRGRMKPRPGAGISLATITGDVQITGMILEPKMTLQKPATVARVGAAFATLGITAVGTAIADAADAKREDPCEQVFGAKAT